MTWSTRACLNVCFYSGDFAVRRTGFAASFAASECGESRCSFDVRPFW
jgi:hypothetical protein